LSVMGHKKDLDKIVQALQAAGKIYRSRSMASVQVDKKSGGEPVTDAEQEVNQLLFKMLVQEGEGWLSEESADNADRLTRSRIWLVDPLDGTKEYISGIPEWCISIALLEDGDLVAAGAFNPCTDEIFYGTRETGVVSAGGTVKNPALEDANGRGPVVLGSRSEVKRGEWERFRCAKFRLHPMGSVAYKLALVAAGKAEATWTLVPKHEWDVAAGAALLHFSGGIVLRPDGCPPLFNQRNILFPGLIGFSAAGIEKLRPFLDGISTDPAFQDCQPWTRALLDRNAHSSNSLHNHS
jgi:myo-inositol-1(or 4)-monophosphatase